MYCLFFPEKFSLGGGGDCPPPRATTPLVERGVRRPSCLLLLSVFKFKEIWPGKNQGILHLKRPTNHVMIGEPKLLSTDEDRSVKQSRCIVCSKRSCAFLSRWFTDRTCARESNCFVYKSVGRNCNFLQLRH